MNTFKKIAPNAPLTKEQAQEMDVTQLRKECLNRGINVKGTAPTRYATKKQLIRRVALRETKFVYTPKMKIPILIPESKDGLSLNELKDRMKKYGMTNVNAGKRDFLFKRLQGFGKGNFNKKVCDEYLVYGWIRGNVAKSTTDMLPELIGLITDFFPCYTVYILNDGIDISKTLKMINPYPLIPTSNNNDSEQIRLLRNHAFFANKQIVQVQVEIKTSSNRVTIIGRGWSKWVQSNIRAGFILLNNGMVYIVINFAGSPILFQSDEFENVKIKQIHYVYGIFYLLSRKGEIYQVKIVKNETVQVNLLTPQQIGLVDPEYEKIVKLVTRHRNLAVITTNYCFHSTD
eukprot:100376_1